MGGETAPLVGDGHLASVDTAGSCDSQLVRQKEVGSFGNDFEGRRPSKPSRPVVRDRIPPPHFQGRPQPDPEGRSASL